MPRIAEAESCWVFASDGEGVSLCVGDWEIWERAGGREEWLIFETGGGVEGVGQLGRIEACVRVDLGSWLKGMRHLARETLGLIDFSFEQGLEESLTFKLERMEERRQRLLRGSEALEALPQLPADGERWKAWYELHGDREHSFLSRAEAGDNLK